MRRRGGGLGNIQDMNHPAPREHPTEHPTFGFRRSARLRERAQSLAILGAIAGFWVIVIALEVTVQSLGAVQFSR